jgi:homoserine O-acetyltransferase
VQRQVLSLGIETGQVARAVGIARSLAMCTYRSDREFAERFVPAANGADSAVGYLDHCGEHFAARFDVHAYLCLSHSIDAHEIRPGEIGIPLDLAGFNSDQIVPVRQLVEFRRLLGGTGSLTLADSPFGHDAFLKENDAVSSVIRNHLETIR